MYKLAQIVPCFFLISFFFLLPSFSSVLQVLGGLVSLEETTKVFLILVILAGSYHWYQSHIFVTMTETRSVAAFTDKFNMISKAVDQHEAEFNVLHQKLDVVTTML